MDRLRAIAVFVAVADSGSLSAASRRLGEPLANISRLLAQLETHVGAILIERTTRRMTLTDAGRDYLAASRQVLETLEAADLRVAGRAQELSGELAVTAPVSFGRQFVVPLVADFLAAYPRTNTRLMLMDRVVDLVEENIDAAIRIGDLPDSALLATRVGTLQLVTCAAPAFLERHGAPTSPSQLADMDCVTFLGMAGGARWTFKSKRHGRKSVRVRSRLAVNTADAAVSAAALGVGITRVLSYQAEAALAGGDLRRILERFDDTEIPVHVVYRPTGPENPRVRAFVEQATEALRDLQRARR